MTEERVPAQVTREDAKHYILLTLDRFRVMTLHLADNKSRLPSALNGNEGGLDLLYELEARDFYRNLMFLYTSDIFEVLSSEGLRELLLKCRELSDRFCLKVRIAEDIRVVEDPPAGELSLSQTEDADKESLWDSFLGALQGEFNEEPSIRSIFIDMGLNLVPIVGQAMDGRDIIACLDKLVRQKRHQEIMVWVTLVLTAIGCVPGAGDVIKSIGKAIIKGADDITITLLKKLDAEDTYTAFVKFRQTLQASTEEAVATINVWLKKAENKYKETELAELLSTANECMNKAVEFVQAKIDEFGWKVFGREDALQKINKLSEFGIDRQKKIIKILEESPEGTIAQLSNLQKGNYGEMKTDIDLEKDGRYQRVSNFRVTSLKDKGHHGIDGIYKNMNPPPDFIIVESKYLGAEEAVNESFAPTMSKVKNGRQMDFKWIEKRLEGSIDDKKLLKKIQKALQNNRVASVAAKIDKKGNITYYQLDADGKVITDGVTNSPIIYNINKE